MYIKLMRRKRNWFDIKKIEEIQFKFLHRIVITQKKYLVLESDKTVPVYIAKKKIRLTTPSFIVNLHNT